MAPLGIDAVRVRVEALDGPAPALLGKPAWPDRWGRSRLERPSRKLRSAHAGGRPPCENSIVPSAHRWRSEGAGRAAPLVSTASSTQSSSRWVGGPADGQGPRGLVTLGRADRRRRVTRKSVSARRRSPATRARSRAGGRFDRRPGPLGARRDRANAGGRRHDRVGDVPVAGCHHPEPDAAVAVVHAMHATWALTATAPVGRAQSSGVASLHGSAQFSPSKVRPANVTRRRRSPGPRAATG